MTRRTATRRVPTWLITALSMAAIGAIWFAILKSTSPATLVAIQHDLET